MIWFTADTHLGHHNIIGYCNRPFKTTEEMDNTITERWNKVVKPEDTVIVLGDVAFKNTTLMKIKALNGIKWLIRGNHDRGFSDTKFKNVGFEMIFKRPHQFVPIEERPLFINCAHAPLPENFKMGAINLCGHVHDKWLTRNNFLNVGVDQWNFTPISFDQVYTTYVKEYPELSLRRTLNRSFY